MKKYLKPKKTFTEKIKEQLESLQELLEADRKSIQETEAFVESIKDSDNPDDIELIKLYNKTVERQQESEEDLQYTMDTINQFIDGMDITFKVLYARKRFFKIAFIVLLLIGLMIAIRSVKLYIKLRNFFYKLKK